MKVIAFYNIKGGVGKTVSSLAFAQILHNDYNKKILLIDIDKQANATKSLGCYNSNGLSSADLLTSKEVIVNKVIRHSEYGIDVIPANYNLVSANREVQGDVKRPSRSSLHLYRINMTIVLLTSLLMTHSLQLMLLLLLMIFLFLSNLNSMLLTEWSMLSMTLRSLKCLMTEFR